MNRFLKRKRDERESSEKSKKVVVRKNDPEFIKYGFTNAGTDLEPKAQCVECTQILSNEALKPSKLQRRLNNTRKLQENQKNISREKERVCRDSKESYFR